MKKTQTGILKVKNIINKRKSSGDRLNRRMERIQERFRELENRTRKITQSKQQRENTP